MNSEKEKRDALRGEEMLLRVVFGLEMQRFWYNDDLGTRLALEQLRQMYTEVKEDNQILYGRNVAIVLLAAALMTPLPVKEPHTLVLGVIGFLALGLSALLSSSPRETRRRVNRPVVVDEMNVLEKVAQGEPCESLVGSCGFSGSSRRQFAETVARERPRVTRG